MKKSNMFKKLEKTAQEVLKKTGKHTPQIMYKYNGEMVVALLCFDGDEAKDKMLEVLRNLISEKRVEHYFVIMETWVGENMNVRPSKDSKRKEALMITEYKKDLTVNMVMHLFHKENEKVIFDEKQELSTTDEGAELSSRWNFFLEDAMDEIIERKRIEQFNQDVSEEEREKMWQSFKAFADEGGLEVTKEMFEEKMLEMVKDGRIRKKTDE